jgi:hypothetical protein
VKLQWKIEDGDSLEGIWNGAEGKWYVLQKEFTVSGSYSLNINALMDVYMFKRKSSGTIIKVGSIIVAALGAFWLFERLFL